MCRKCICLLVVLFFNSLLFADSYELVTFDIGGATTTYLYGINNHGWIVGGHNNNLQGFIGFMYNLDSHASFNFDFGAQHDYAAGISDTNDVVGHYNNWWDFLIHGFYYDSSTPAGYTIDYPDATYTYLYGVNSDRQLVGAYQITTFRGFVYDPDQQIWKTFAVDGFDHTYANDINDSGMIVGRASSNYESVGFITQDRGDTFQIINHPTQKGPNTYTEAYGVNNKGDIVGRYNSSGFVKKGSQWVPVNYPGAWRTIVEDINDSGVIIGWYEYPGTGVHGFIGYPRPEVCGDAFHPIPDGDIDGNCRVNLNDLASLSAAWMRLDCTEPDNCGGADYESPAGTVGLAELLSMAENWLLCIMEGC